VHTAVVALRRRWPVITTTPEVAFAAIGGYVVTPAIIDELRELTTRWYQRREGEVYLTDAISAYAHGHAVYGQVISGRWYDTGNPADYLVAQMAFALAHPQYGPILRRLAHDLGDTTNTSSGPPHTTTSQHRRLRALPRPEDGPRDNGLA
jgi:UTP--glucose-1-phosphate uridylyltransferase